MIGFFEDAALRLQALAPALLRVEHAQSDKAMDAFALSHDVTALVHPLSDQALPVNNAGLVVSQSEVWTFGVTMALVFPGGFEQWATARAQIKTALRGWSWEDRLATPVEYAGGQTTEYTLGEDGGRWLSVLRFRTSILETYGLLHGQEA
jgi:hypothetical protein